MGLKSETKQFKWAHSLATMTKCCKMKVAKIEITFFEMANSRFSRMTTKCHFMTKEIP